MTALIPLLPLTPGPPRTQDTMTAPTALLSRTGHTRENDVMIVNFAISPRGDQNIPENDARRVSDMRRLANARLSYCGLSALADNVELVVSELISNAIKHSRGTGITMTFLLVSGLLLLDVCDKTGWRPQIQQPDNEAETGRGLLLVERIAQEHNGSWGVSPDGTSTWCVLPTAPTGRR